MKTQFVTILASLIICCYVADAGAADGDEAIESLIFPTSYEVTSVANGGTITGVVKLEGNAPKMKKLEITKDQNVCGKTDKHDESVVVGEGNTLQNTIVYLMDISAGSDFAKDAKTKYEIDQNGCQFTPHMTLLPLGQQLMMLNSDKIMHNIHIFSEVNKAYNKAQPKSRRKMRLPKVKKAEGPVPIKCDVHGWMKGWLVHIPHPYFAVSNEKGEYKIENVPPGTYKLGYWQESCETNKDAPVSVTVAAGGTVTQGFTLALKK